MFTAHLDQFNEAINNFDGPEHERDSVLYHENSMYTFAKEYLDHVDTYDSHELDLCLRYMRYDINAILVYLELDLNDDCVMYETLDVLAMNRKELAS